MNLYLDDNRMPHMSNSEGRGLGVSYASEDKWVKLTNSINMFISIYYWIIEIKKTSFDKFHFVLYFICY